MKSRPEKGGRTFQRMLVWVGLASLYTLPLLTVGAGVDHYFKIAEIKGEATEDKHKDWIEAFSFRHGVTRVVQAGAGSGQSQASPPEFSELTISKPVDRATPPLFSEAVTGLGHEMELELVRNSPLRERFYRIKLYDAIVTSLAQSSTGDRPNETLSVSYAKIELTFTEHDDRGNPTVATTAFYDITSGQGGLGNTAPTLSAIPDTTTPEDVPATIGFIVNDAETPPGNLILSKSSSNPGLVPLDNITVSGTDSNRLATIQPQTNQAGAATITLTVSDGSLSTTQSFLLNVISINDPPQLSAIPSQTTQEGVPVTIGFTVEDVDTPLSELGLTGRSDNPPLVPEANITFAGAGPVRSVTITPVPGQFGDTAITLTVTDGAAPSSTSFLLTVNRRIPNAPTDILLSNQEVAESSSSGLGVGLLTAVDPDSTTHTFTLTDSAGGRFAVVGNELRVDNGALLDYETAPTHTILVKATDSDGLSFSKPLIITVLNVNEPPVFLVPDPSVIQTVSGVDTPITRLRVTDVDAGANPLTLTLQVVNGLTRIGAPRPGVTVSGDGTAEVTLNGSIAELNSLLADPSGVIYQATPGLAGSDLLTATLTDNGHAGLGGPQTVFTTLGIRFYRDSYDRWLHEQFTEAELNNPALEASLWGFHADPDQDRLENLAEYGLGYSPRQPDGHRFPKGTFVEQADQRFFSLTLTRRIDPNLTLTVQVSSALEPGTWTSDPAELNALPPEDLGNGFERARFDDRKPASAGQKRFMRIQWTLRITPP